jgi:peroxiredoxin
MRLRPEGTTPRRGGRFLVYGLTATILLIAGLLLTSRSGFLASRMLPTAAEVGAIGPDFTLMKAGEGGELQLSSLRGKPVVLNFFCGCGDCREVAVLWAEQAKELGDAHLISVMHDHTGYNPANLKNFRWGTGFQWPILADIGSNVSVAWKSVDCPRIWVLDSHGVVRYKSPGRGTPAETHVADTLAALKALKR